VPKLTIRTGDKEMSKVKKSVKTEETKATSAKDLEDIDKSIEELVAE